MVTNGYINSVLLSYLIKIYAPFPTMEKQILASMCKLDCIQTAQLLILTTFSILPVSFRIQSQSSKITLLISLPPARPCVTEDKD